MRGAETKREDVRRYAPAANVLIGCVCFLWAAAGAHPAPQPSDAHAPKQVPDKRVDWDALWASVVERRLDHWVPATESDQVPMAAIRSPQTDISGKWAVRSRYDGSSLTITRSGPDSYDIVLNTHGCCGSWKLRRTGRYSGGALVLNRPVEEYRPLTYQKLYAIRAGGTEYLVPDVVVGRFQNGVAPDGSRVAEGTWVGFYGFTRTPPPVASKRGQPAPRLDRPQ